MATNSCQALSVALTSAQGEGRNSGDMRCHTSLCDPVTVAATSPRVAITVTCHSSRGRNGQAEGGDIEGEGRNSGDMRCHTSLCDPVTVAATSPRVAITVTCHSSRGRNGQAEGGDIEVTNTPRGPLQEATNAARSLTPPLSSPQLSPALLQPQVTVVATLGELLATLPRRDEMMRLFVSSKCPYWDLEEFTRVLRATIKCIDDTWWCQNVTYNDDDSVTSLSWALAAYKSTSWTNWECVKMATIIWQASLDVLMERWVELARKATKLRNAWWEVVSEAADMAITITSVASYLQEEVAHYGTAQENMVELGQALSGEEGTEGVDTLEAQMRRQAKEAASEAIRTTKMRQRVEAALGLLERLVAACEEATAFPWELQCMIGDIEATMEGTNEVSPDVPEDFVDKVAEAEWLWEANTRLAKEHLLGTVDDIIKFYFDGDPAGPSACGVTERCQRAIEDIPRLLQAQECPQSVPKVSPVSMEPQEVSPPQLQALVAVVATLGKVVATVTGPHRGKFLHESPDSLHEDLKNFTQNLCKILDHGDVTSLGHHSVPSLGRALATLGATPGTTWANVRAAAGAWRESVAKLVDSCDQLAGEATKLRDACRKVVMDQQLMVCCSA
ncbi:uncharacterized protein LOC121339421 [Onychostruthus taczanowskii]|uniref:uncharacterized protein LOC121339421 n=1 Tax=Onychostruthus taczanowskii TaxID=356909 RepID=UPI001B8065BC|nr:uncharacterized protein LOC121339421 [Onychostruthus taczanowskii]